LKRIRHSTPDSRKSDKRIGIVIFTDLDGTLLSHDTYGPGPALEGLRLCKKRGVPVVFVSSKTMTEIEALRRELDNEDPFISENGGAVYVPADQWEKPKGYLKRNSYWRLALGVPHATLMTGLQNAAKTCRTEIEMFSRLPLDRMMEVTGLSKEAARRAQQREFDEPFRIEGENPSILSCLEKELRNKSLNLTRGGRFHHVMGGCDKGKAVRLVMKLYQTIDAGLLFGAVGDAENDLPMFQAVDRPFLIRKTDGSYEKRAANEGVIITDGIGPKGFTEAVRKLTTTS
jgi:mannosyl-3-phosphoglycerate phosphatase